MIRRVSVLLAVAALAWAPAAAAAGEEGGTEVVRSSGAAPVGDADARTVAIDRAFARAVSSAVDTVVAPVVRARYEDAIRDKLLRRARLFVARYQVRQEGDDGESYRVELDAWIAVDKVRATLVGLGIELGARPEPAPGTRARPTLVLLVVANVDGAAHATFGRDGGDGGAVGRAIARELGEYGFAVVGAAGIAPSFADTADGGGPLTDAAAEEIARQVGAGGAVVVGAEVAADGGIRGTRLRGASGASSIRILDTAASTEVGQAEVRAAAYGDSSEAALDVGAARLGREAVSAIAGALEAHWPAAVVTGSGVVVEIAGAQSWAPIREVVRVLARAPGVTAVEARRFRPGYVALQVTTELSAARVARAVTAGTFEEAAIEVRNIGDHNVEIDVRPLPSPEAP